jgi:hypothetical protein
VIARRVSSPKPHEERPDGHLVPAALCSSAEVTAMAKKSTKKNSLVNNINQRKKSGTSRPKSRSTVSNKAYSQMKKGWGKKTAKKK